MNTEMSPLGSLYKNAFGDRFFTQINRTAFYKLKAQSVFDAKFAQTLLKPNTLNIIIGSDSGLLIHYLIDKDIPQGTRYIFVEPDFVLQELTLSGLLPQDLPEAISCIRLEQWHDTIKQHAIQDYLYINSVRSFNALCAEEDNIDEYAELSWHITELLSQLHWQANMALGNETFITQQLNNLADNIIPAQILNQHFKNQTVAILAGGPSLDNFLPWIQQNRDKLVIFTVSRIARQLLAIDLIPDFIFSVDPTELSFDVSKEMLKYGQDVTLVHSYHIFPGLLNQWQGKSLYLGNRLPWQSKLNPQNITGAGPTVTNTAISVAHQFGFSRILLFGVDLCFTPEGFTHAKGSNEHKAGPRFNLTSLTVETYSGKQAPTSCDFASAISTLEYQAAQLKAQGCQLINPSPSAAKIPAISHIPVDEISLTKNNSSNWPEYQADSMLFQNMIAELERAIFQLEAIADLARKALTINTEMYDKNGIIQNYKDKKALDQVEKTLNRKYRKFSKLVKNFGTRSFLKTLRPFHDDWSAEEAKEIGHSYYEAYLEGTKRLIDLLSNSLERIQNRQQESLSPPDFEKILNQWQKDQSYGRAIVWQNQHPDISIPEKYQPAFQEMAKQFQIVLKKEDTRHFKQAKNQADLSLLRKKARTLFKHGKTDSLEDLVQAISAYPDQDEVAPFYSLVNAYLSELQHNPEAALQYYHHIIDSENTSLYEDALSRIAGICIDMKDFSNAELALQCLAQLSDLYMPLYAECLRINGKIMASIDHYNLYISKYPDDILNQLKLAILYKEQNNADAARIMLDYILKKQPENQAAKEMLSEIASG
ncbi:6-hydroxymethylpterin diphosphokinase MptE-like protein [methane-oxidizing endosymbiont of Gigantopelta aegis]|uniref:motility associated factor glycosyltransferase family protein n=1 Tax=methane-oxidizing endosymbiont of Gigantopelta aegis TaxID=2794938 RepID=UPI0018DCF377|nr:6-hydroxymethylpterin diphosphokinase MptE-like protein [methane-oxidizing endosymbiont of Gigantopelta aegis]